MIKREDVLEVLSNVQDPETKKDIVSSNLIEDLVVEGDMIRLTVYVNNPAMHGNFTNIPIDMGSEWMYVGTDIESE